MKSWVVGPEIYILFWVIGSVAEMIYEFNTKEFFISGAGVIKSRSLSQVLKSNFFSSKLASLKWIKLRSKEKQIETLILLFR